MKPILLVILLCCTIKMQAQQKLRPSFDLAVAAGSSQGTLSLGAWHHWKFGNKQRLEIGLGPRISSYFGSKKDFWTAPASISRGSSTPFLVVFSSQETQNWDTLTVQRPWIVSFNAAIQLAYRIRPKFRAGVNIDLIGFSIGRNSPAIFTSDGQQQTDVAKPVPFNLLLTGDLDKGSLNSEFFLQYQLNAKWGLRGIYQFYFAEYQTPVDVQQVPEPNDRFRNKANLLGLGLTYSLN